MDKTDQDEFFPKIYDYDHVRKEILRLQSIRSDYESLIKRLEIEIADQKDELSSLYLSYSNVKKQLMALNERRSQDFYIFAITLDELQAEIDQLHQLLRTDLTKGE